MKKKYELVVKEINNYPDKIAVTVALEIGGHPSLLLPHVAISLDRTEGATLEFYEAEAKKQAKQFFMDVAAGLCEGDEQSPEKRPVILEACLMTAECDISSPRYSSLRSVWASKCTIARLS